MKKKQKGEFGYINYYKLLQGIISFTFVIVMAVLYITGLLIFKTNKNALTVLAILVLLPAARYIVSWIVIFPYKSSDEALYNKLREYPSKNKGWLGISAEDVRNTNENDILEPDKRKAVIVSDLVLTYSEHIMNVDFLVVREGHVIAYSDHKKIDESYTSDYIKRLLDNSSDYKSFKFYTKEENFLKAYREIQNNSNSDKRKVYRNDLLIVRNILPFSI